ncbi:hypothetical protein SAMN05660835_01727 [Desulfurella multipotens]|uniref:Uncharacterized protein n=2 Tax=Desulfurella multipotens TaxID=79269 RepID=A0A1G6R794_9BACT|nr:hypothetical protein [Desulfurella multipotens]SDC99917.1 hypothetical protein SAMN05660835_01727 [Desulfurella multipotens]
MKYSIFLGLLFLLIFLQKTMAMDVVSNSNVNLYGSIKQYFVWGNNNFTLPPPTYPANTAYNGLKNGNQLTVFQTYTGTTKLGLDVKSDKIQANIESDFESDNNTLWLLKAYFKY